MSRPVCTGCGEPIKADEAALVIHTITTKERWHIRCLRPAERKAADVLPTFGGAVCTELV